MTRRHAFILSLFLLTSACGKQATGEGEAPGSGTSPAENIFPDGQNIHSDTLSVSLLDSVVKQGVPRAVATLAFNKFDQFQSQVKNSTYLSIVDFTKNSGKARFFMVDISSGHVDALMVAHGVGSDPNNTGTPINFSNVPDSRKSSLGAFIINEQFQSTNHGTANRLDGLESSNNLARPRALLLHSASYVSTSRSKMGMSWGCFAISLDWIGRALKRLTGGSFLYAYGNAQASVLDDLQIQQIMTNPGYQWINESEDAPVDGEGG